MSPEVLGLALTYAIALSGLMQVTVRLSAEFENVMTSVERNMEYTRLDQEAPRCVKMLHSMPLSNKFSLERQKEVVQLLRVGLEKEGLNTNPSALLTDRDYTLSSRISALLFREALRWVLSVEQGLAKALFCLLFSGLCYLCVS